MKIQDKVAVITGAASGIGRAVCQELAGRGAGAIAMVDMSDDVAECAAEFNEHLGREVAHPFQGDVTKEDFRETVYDSMIERFGTVIPTASASSLSVC